MRYLIAVFAALSLFAVGAQAQGNYQAKSLLSATAAVTKTATTNYGTAAYIIDATKWDKLDLQLSFKLDAVPANGSNIVLTFSKSLDKVKWTSSASDFVWTVAANSTNEVSVTTNLDMTSVGYLRLDSINNQNTNGTMTNIVLRYSVKPKGRG